MVTEQQRKQLLTLLNNPGISHQEISNKIKELYKIDTSPREIEEAIQKLRQVRGE